MELARQSEVQALLVELELLEQEVQPVVAQQVFVLP